MLAHRGFMAANAAAVSTQFQSICWAHSLHAGGGNSWKYRTDVGSIHPPPPKNFKPTHIIVGAGSAGCVLANRLSENPDHVVLLIEAGPKDNWWDWRIHMPAALMYNLCHDKYNWFYHTLAQPHMDDRVFYWPRGRVWGGSSTLNAMVYVRGHPADFDRWEREGATGWSYKNCLPYFKKAQTHPLSTGADDPFRGHAGPLHVEQAGCANPLHEAFMAAGEQLGIGRTPDMNGARQEGFGPMDMTIKGGVRWSASRAYLRPVLDRSNLYTSTGMTCTRVLFNGRRAIGVELVPQVNSLFSGHVDSFTRQKIYCESDVILAGGAINSPQVLMSSGVGPAQHLKSLGIPLVQDMQGVGSNLQDHLEIYVQQSCTKPITLYEHSSWRFPHNVIRVGLQWVYNRTGLGASSHLESGGFARTSAEKDYPDIQFHFLPSTVHDDGRKPATSHGFQCHVGPMQSRSRGTVRLQSADPRLAPLMDPNYMSHEEDWADFRRCVRLTREIFDQPAFDEFRGGELAPGAECQTDEQIDAFVRRLAASAYHPSCTCKMGASTDNMAVVDPTTMGVHGLDNLKVVDASVMPSITNGNLNAPTIMIAERAADLIAGRTPLPAETPAIWSPSAGSPLPAYLASSTAGQK